MLLIFIVVYRFGRRREVSGVGAGSGRVASAVVAAGRVISGAGTAASGASRRPAVGGIPEDLGRTTGRLGLVEAFLRLLERGKRVGQAGQVEQQREHCVRVGLAGDAAHSLRERNPPGQRNCATATSIAPWHFTTTKYKRAPAKMHVYQCLVNGWSTAWSTVRASATTMGEPNHRAATASGADPTPPEPSPESRATTRRETNRNDHIQGYRETAPRNASAAEPQPRLTVTTPIEPPTLDLTAARALLRILIKTADREGIQ